MTDGSTEYDEKFIEDHGLASLSTTFGMRATIEFTECSDSEFQSFRVAWENATDKI